MYQNNVSVMMICIYFSGTILYFFSFYSYFNGKNIEKYFQYLFLNFRDHYFFDRGDSKSSGLRNHFVSIILQNSDVEGIAQYIPGSKNPGITPEHLQKNHSEPFLHYLPHVHPRHQEDPEKKYTGHSF